MSQGVSNRPVSDLVEPSVDLVLHHHLVAVPVGAWRRVLSELSVGAE